MYRFAKAPFLALHLNPMAPDSAALKSKLKNNSTSSTPQNSQRAKSPSPSPNLKSYAILARHRPATNSITFYFKDLSYCPKFQSQFHPVHLCKRKLNPIIPTLTSLPNKLPTKTHCQCSSA
ncbi:hypothetical protein ONS95_005919 [Cadophora gregata]|uniref:uncharacterized protein n=1 Tax=Cadophora gregata TaxID=51156 RepID=UPI0026DCA219|nr:uncharacterized protein ONS95_005919 [Cadophora gregata]KAK0102296.1 hypothetical protein ONS95_005919 [Cadophora gregata]KAK0103922.1 hypothetical protein ONS96_005029 [Cadophora gregata f. sp. sojae]